MISNLDRNRLRNETEAVRKSNKQFYFESETARSEILKSAKFVFYMEKVLKAYETGAASIRFPLFASVPFLNVVLSRFRSYNFIYFLYPDYKKRRFIFVKI